MVIRFLRDFSERKKRSNMRRQFAESEGIPFYDADVEISEKIGFYEEQRTKDYWKQLFGVVASFCLGSTTVLDVGCGPYELIAVRNSENATGVDISNVVLKKLKSFGFQGQVVQADCLHLPFRDASFDAVFSDQVIEHMLSEDNVKRSVVELQRVSNSVMVITPNAVFSRKIHDPTHFFFFTARTMKRLMPTFKLYAAKPLYEKTLAYYLLYESPRLRRTPIIGKIIVHTLERVDASRLLVWLNRKLWPGSMLVAVKIRV